MGVSSPLSCFKKDKVEVVETLSDSEAEAAVEPAVDEAEVAVEAEVQVDETAQGE